MTEFPRNAIWSICACGLLLSFKTSASGLNFVVIQVSAQKLMPDTAEGLSRLVE